MVYSAGISVSSTEPQVFEMAGQITVLPEDAVYRLEFSGVKLLTYKVNGGAFFEYAGSAFSGKIWGSMSMFGGAVSLTAPKGGDNDKGTVGLYFGADDWEIYCGRLASPIQVLFSSPMWMATCSSDKKWGFASEEDSKSVRAKSVWGSPLSKHT